MNEGEKKLVEYNFGMSGSFYKNFFETAFRADGFNLSRLEAGFPQEIQALKRYRSEPGYWDGLKEEFMNKKNS